MDIKVIVGSSYGDEINWIEAICDWEASGYTKPNSLLNAYETCKKFHPDKLYIVVSLLKKENCYNGK